MRPSRPKTYVRDCWRLGFLIFALGHLTSCLPSARESGPQVATLFINELHYDNEGDDQNEAVEIAGTAGSDLSGWSVALYNGNGGDVYDTLFLSGSLPNELGGYGALALELPPDGLQNGNPDGLALVSPSGEVLEFLSYEGSFTAVSGPAAGLTSSDIGVSESGNTAPDSSLQLSGLPGSPWRSRPSSFGMINPGQRLVPPEQVDCSADYAIVPVHSVQGSGAETPIGGNEVVIEAVVTGAFQEADAGDGGDLGGFFVQEEASDVDANPQSSEGLFVYLPGGPDVAKGDLVRVAGIAEEFNGNTQVNARLGELSGVAICGSAELPPAQTLALPFAASAELEALENMRVVLPQTLVISEYFNFDRFGEIVVALPPEGRARLFQPTAVYLPGSTEAANLAELNRRSRILLDDGRTSQNPDPARHPNGLPFNLDNRFRGGDVVEGAEGILTYAFGDYRLQPTAAATYSAVNVRPDQPPEVGGSLKVAAFNVLNYFNGDGSGGGFPTERGADDPEELVRQTQKIVAALAALDADVVGLVELENDSGGPNSALADLTGALNESLGAEVYAYVDTGVIGNDAIKVGFIYKPAAVTLEGDFAVLDTPAFVDPFASGRGKNRPALAVTFQSAAGATFTVVVNHFKSKGSECGSGDDDREQGNCNGTRTAAARELLNWLQSDPTGSGDPDVLIIGDLNAYAQEDPIRALEEAGYTDLLERTSGEPVYSYVFSGQFSYLDYALASASLLPQVTGAAPWRVNADEPDILDYDTTFKADAQDALFEPNPYRASDHDPVVVGLELK